MARSLIALQDFQEAEKQIQAAIKTGGGTLVEAQTVLANLRRHQGLGDESISEYRKALRLARGNSFEAHIGLAIALNEQGSVDEAVREYRIGIIRRTWKLSRFSTISLRRFLKRPAATRKQLRHIAITCGSTLRANLHWS